MPRWTFCLTAAATPKFWPGVRLAEPALLVDINKLAELDFIRRGDDGDLRIGALTRQRRVERDALVAEAAPLLHEIISCTGGCIARQGSLPMLEVSVLCRWHRLGSPAAG